MATGARYREIRRRTEALAAPLAIEDQVVQSSPDASPTKWHLAHTSWFFETFVLPKALPTTDPRWAVLFNSYYEGAGPRHPRAQRGLLSRPTVAEVLAHRARVDEAVLATEMLGDAIELGLQHEQQHQELILTDVKTVLASNPLSPAYRSREVVESAPPPPLEFIPYAEGLREIGHGDRSFCFDNERPRHRVFLEPFAIGSRLVTAGEWLAFIHDRGYARPELWLSDGWAMVQAQALVAPLYWSCPDSGWVHDTLAGRRAIDPHEPVCHVSYYEADAFARWSNARLPTEQEWEVASAHAPSEGAFLDDEHFHPRPACARRGLQQMFGDVWEWTSSAYSPYPGYRPLAGTLGEYNGKFMSGQMVLRGGSCATPRDHVRATYRNFFPPHARWQFSGVRLCRSVA